MAVLVTARYELSLFSGEKNDDSRAIVKLILLIAIVLSVVSTLCLVLFGVLIEQIPSVVRSYSVGLAFVIFGMGINKAALSVLALQQEFNKLGVARILLAIAIALAQVIAGYFALGVSGLIYWASSRCAVSNNFCLFVVRASLAKKLLERELWYGKKYSA
ncbi:hypothetical protein PSH74_20395 [Pseudomonas hefeiensis]|uniref:hypothetical protein n=1 Tax=Pseudomonas hefeiensis TaxID=2738125 RepID=UPI002734F54C|nr:hypothetical protein [Pseudomonas sp. FP821]WLI38567.1 hypothetical protein PSH74_20395 [Pseudomonas sp. FP821]